MEKARWNEAKCHPSTSGVQEASGNQVDKKARKYRPGEL